MPEHIAELNRTDTAALREWLVRPNGAHVVPQKPRGVPHSSTRVVFEAVEGGGILVRTHNYAEDIGREAKPAAASKPDPRHAIIGTRDNRHRIKCLCGATIELLGTRRDAKGSVAVKRLAELHVERGNAAEKLKQELREREEKRSR